MSRSNDKPSVEAYFGAVPAERRELIDTLHTSITRLYPNATADLQYNMPTYRANDGWAAIANRRNYVSLYTCGAQHLADFKRRHPKIKDRQGLHQLEPTETLPVADIEQVVRHAIDHANDHA